MCILTSLGQDTLTKFPTRVREREPPPPPSGMSLPPPACATSSSFSSPPPPPPPPSSSSSLASEKSPLSFRRRCSSFCSYLYVSLSHVYERRSDRHSSRERRFKAGRKITDRVYIYIYPASAKRTRQGASERKREEVLYSLENSSEFAGF